MMGLSVRQGREKENAVMTNSKRCAEGSNRIRWSSVLIACSLCLVALQGTQADAERNVRVPFDQVGITADDMTLDAADVQRLTEAAIVRWRTSGVTARQVEVLRGLTFSVEDLGGDHLGRFDNGHITLDDDAVGAGWFIDTTPFLDEEYGPGAGPMLVATEGAEVRGVDLLTVLMHEQGHALGLSDGCNETQSPDLMAGTIAHSVRLLPSTGQASGTVSGILTGPHFADLVAYFDGNNNTGVEADASNFVEFNGKLYYEAESNGNGTAEPWVYDPATGTASQITNANPPSGDDSNVTHQFVFNNRLYAVMESDVGRELFQYNTGNGQYQLHTDLNGTGDGYPRPVEDGNGDMVIFNGDLILVADDTGIGEEIFRLRTNNSLELFFDGNNNTGVEADASNFVEFNGDLFYEAESNGSGTAEPWVYDPGTGTRSQITNANAPTGDDSNVTQQFVFNNRLYAVMESNVGRELFQYNTGNGQYQLHTNLNGAGDGYPRPVQDENGDMVIFNGDLILVADDTGIGEEIFRLRTNNSLELFFDGNNNTSVEADASNFVEFNGDLFYEAESNGSGTAEPWVYDPATGTRSQITNANAPTGDDSNVTQQFVFNGNLYAVMESNVGRELFKYNTGNGRYELDTNLYGSNDGYPNPVNDGNGDMVVFSVDNRLVLTANNASGHDEIFYIQGGPLNTAPTISGTTGGQSVNDTATRDPFSGVTIGDADGDTLDVTVTLSASANGTLAGGSFTHQGGGVYRRTGALPATATTAIRALTFDPTENQVEVGSTIQTTFTIDVDDGTAPAVSDTTTTVVATSINDQPGASNTTHTIVYTVGIDPVPLDPAIVVSDVDLNESITANLTLNNTATGSLSANNGAGYNSGTGLWTITGSVSAVNTALNNVAFEPVAGNATDTAVSVSIADGGENGTVAVTGTITLDVQQVDIDLQVSKTDTPDPVTAGSGTGNLTHTVTVTNTGPNNATGVALSEAVTLPAGSSIVSITPSGSTTYLPANAPNGTWTVGRLVSGASETLTIVMTVAAATADGAIVSDTATVTGAHQTLINTGNDSATESTTVQRRVDLQVSSLDTPDPVTAGSGSGNLTHTVTVTNAGPSDATGVALSETVTLPAGASIVSITPSGATTYAPPNMSPGTWSVSDIASGATETLTVVITVGADTADGAFASSTATVTAFNETLINTGDDTATENTTVQRRVDLQVSSLDTPDPVTAGSGSGNLTHTVTVTNAGPSDATGVTLSETVTVPAGASIVSITPSGATTYAPPNTSPGTWSVGDIASGATETLTVVITADISTADGAIVSSSATVTATNETLINTGDDSATENTTVQRRVDLRVGIVDTPDPVTAGTGSGNLTHAVTVTNAGPSNATGVTISETVSLPAGASIVSVIPSGGTNYAPPNTSPGTWTIGDLASNASETLTVVITVGADTTDGEVISSTAVVSAANETLVNTGDDSATENTTVSVEAALVTAIGDTPDPVTAGTQLSYAIDVANTGPGDTADGTVLAVLSDQSTYVSDTGGCVQPGVLIGFGARLEGDDVVPPVSSPAAGESFFVLDTSTNVLRFGVHVTDFAGSITSAHIYSGAAGVNGAIVHTLYEGAPQFDDANPIAGALQLTAGQASDLQTQPFYVNLHSDAFPAGELRGQLAATVQTPLQCSVGPLVAGANSIFDVTVLVSADNADGSTLSHGTIVASTAADPNRVDLPAGALEGATGRALTTVETVADLVITKADTPDPVLAGTPLSYTVRVDNNGPSDASDVVVTDTLPSGVTFVSTSGCGEDPGGVPTCSLGTIAAGSFEEYTINLTVDSGTVGIITNQASVTSSTTEGNPGDENTTEQTSVEAAADLAITKLDTPDPVLAGTNLTYTIEVTNSGPSDALGVVVTDTLPAGVTLASTSGCGEDPFGVPACSLGSIMAGGSAQITITVAVDSSATGSLVNQATVASSTPEAVPGNETASATTTVDTAADLVLTKGAAPDPVVAGTQLVYTLTVTNNGPSDALDVVVTDTLPPEATFISSSGCAEDPGGVPTCSLGPIVAGGMKQYTVAVEVDSATLGSINNLASVTSTTTEANPGDESVSTGTTVVAEADLAVTKIDSVDPVVAGTGMVYTITVTNNGPSDALDVVATDTLPANVTLSASSGCAEDPTGAPVCSLGTIVAGGMKQFTLSVDVDSAAQGTITNLVSVVSSTTEGNPGDESDSEDTVVIEQADLSINMSDSPDPVLAGTQLTYFVRVDNAGPSEARNVVVTDTLPAGVALASTQGCPEDPDGVPTCSLNSIAAGGFAEFTIFVNVDSATRGQIVNSATAATSATDPVPGNDGTSETTTVDAEVDLVLIKTDSADPLPGGDPLVYTLTVTNDGPSDATDVVVTDILPSATTLVESSGCAEDPSGAPTCSLGTVTAGTVVQYTLTVSLIPSPPPSITNSASVTSLENDSDPSNNSDDEETILDTEPPAVTVLDSVVGTGDGSIVDCESALVPIDEFLVTFSEGMFDPSGDIDPNDVTNPGNYQLVAAGPDGDFSTMACGTVTGDDLELNVNWAVYDPATNIARLMVDGLPSSQIRFMVCGGAIMDLAGNPLDGDGDGNGGDDFIVTFRSDPTNLFDNGHFDCPETDLDGWTISDPVEITRSADDVDGSTSSGSVQIMQLAANTRFEISQCVPFSAGFKKELSSRLRMSSTNMISLQAGCEFFATPNCGPFGSGFDHSFAVDLISDSGGAWIPLPSSHEVPVGTAAVRCGFIFFTGVGADFTAWLDDLVCSHGGTEIFEDDFESGDTVAWSATIP